MTDLFTESDFTDAGGYMKNAKYVVDIANERMKALIIERDMALDLVKLCADTMGNNAQMINALLRERGKKV